MNIYLENVDLSSRTGPNYFAQKLMKYMNMRGTLFDPSLPYDLKLTFIESQWHHQDLPMVQRLDGIYFNANFDCEKMNYNIRKTYEKAKGVIFQTEFNRDLIFNWFGEHDNYCVINNGADTLKIGKIRPQFDGFRRKFDNIWTCAAHWHIFKRLGANIDYFLNFSSENDCLLVAGPKPSDAPEHPRVFYVGNLQTDELLSLFKAADYFIHLAYLDHCPNVVIDARASGCKIICSSSGGTKEVAGQDALVVQEDPWDFSFIDAKVPPQIDFLNINQNKHDAALSMTMAAKNYEKFLKGVV